MKKALIITLGLCLFVGGTLYARWWWTAIRQFGDLATAAQAEDFSEDSPRFGRAVKASKIAGVDVFAPAPADSTADPAELAMKISRIFRAHWLGGVAVALIGLGITVVGVWRRGRRKP